MINLRKSRIKRKIARYVEREKPDMIVSVMPLFNYALYDAAVRYDIPFLVLTTDLDTKNYVHGLKKPSYKKFRYSLAFNDPMLEKKIRKANIDPKYIVYPGFPVRTDFFEEKNNDKIYEKFGLPRDRPIILLVMGACGSSTIIRYAKEILSIDHPLHLVACVGRNKRLKKKIEKIKIKGPATVTALGFTREISDLMSISSLLVSKPGPTTVCEAVQMKLPLLLDHTSGHLDWEKMNIDFVQKNNFGGMVSRPGKIKDRVSRYLFDKPFYSKIKSNLANYQPNKFPEKIRSLVDEMLSL